MTRSRLVVLSIGFATLVFSSACSLEHHRYLANGRDGGGYPTDIRWRSVESENQPLNGMSFASEPQREPVKGFKREVLVDPGGPVGDIVSSHHSEEEAHH